MRWLLIPDEWRIELHLRPEERAKWLGALVERPTLRLVDWSSPTPVAGDKLVVPRLDLAAAELVLKVAPDVSVLIGAKAAALPGGCASLLSAALSRATRRLEGVDRPLPPNPDAFLDTLLRQVDAR